MLRDWRLSSTYQGRDCRNLRGQERWRSAQEETDKDGRRFENQVKGLTLMIHELEDDKGAQKKMIGSLEDDVEDLRMALRTMGHLHENAGLRTIWLTGAIYGLAQDEMVGVRVLEKVKEF
jgi:hypothetical protein